MVRKDGHIYLSIKERKFSESFFSSFSYHLLSCLIQDFFSLFYLSEVNVFFFNHVSLFIFQIESLTTFLHFLICCKSLSLSLSLSLCHSVSLSLSLSDSVHFVIFLATSHLTSFPITHNYFFPSALFPISHSCHKIWHWMFVRNIFQIVSCVIILYQYPTLCILVRHEMSILRLQDRFSDV